MNLYFKFVLIILTIVSFTCSAWGGEIIRACFTDWPPYSYLENKKPKGLSIELYRSIIQRANLKISFVHYPWKRCKTEVSRGTIDAAVDGGAKLPNTLNVKKRPIPWVLVFWVHKDSPHKSFQNYSQFNGQKVGYVASYGYPVEFSKYQGFGSKTGTRNDLTGLKMLNKGRFEIFFGDLVNNSSLVKQYDLEIRAIGPAVQIIFLNLTFSKKLAIEHQKFETALETMYKDGSIDRFYKKYFGLTYGEFITKYSRDSINQD